MHPTCGYAFLFLSLFSQVEVQVVLIDEILLKVVLNERKNINHALGLLLFEILSSQVHSVSLDPLVGDAEHLLIAQPSVVDEGLDELVIDLFIAEPRVVDEGCDVLIEEHLVADKAVLDEVASLVKHGDVALDDVTEEVAENVESIGDHLVLSQELLHSGRQASLVNKMLDVRHEIHNEILDPVQGFIRELNKFDLEGAVHLSEELICVSVQGILDNRQLVLDVLDELLALLGLGKVHPVRLEPLVVLDPGLGEGDRAVVVLVQGLEEFVDNLADFLDELVDRALVVVLASDIVDRLTNEVLDLRQDRVLLLNFFIVGLE